uniref:uncharacterized protein LOC108949782 n=1 Tax=Ciona intestinalis TaxID=7719 RepID=UPI00089DAAEA|nr:uncharacterized protein LOC108949782 [Ciona intestinalis]XP_018668978.1 uncharacterized protein LOC108949782 [Ciona intestinalis]|eukprot:XP_018668977.1 uncharacterized protein LOC108949782 [Ciona intestinalis]
MGCGQSKTTIADTPTHLHTTLRTEDTEPVTTPHNNNKTSIENVVSPSKNETKNQNQFEDETPTSLVVVEPQTKVLTEHATAEVTKDEVKKPENASVEIKQSYIIEKPLIKEEKTSFKEENIKEVDGVRTENKTALNSHVVNNGVKGTVSEQDTIVKTTNPSLEHNCPAKLISQPPDCSDVISLASEYTVDSKSDDENVNIAENILSSALVENIMVTVSTASELPTTAGHTEDIVVNTTIPVSSQNDVNVCETVEGVARLAEKEVKSATVDSNTAVVPAPSGNPVVENTLHIDTAKDIQLHAAMRFSCSATDNQVLPEIATQAEVLHLSRTFLTNREDSLALCRTLANLSRLKKLVVKGNNAGPVAVRALLFMLTQYAKLEELDLSDNMADPSCADHLANFISGSKNLKCLNLSGNQFGKESLSKALNVGLSATYSLVHLDVSGCGATNLHGLFEALRSGFISKQSKLNHLDISNNHMNDGQQPGIDISLLLETSNCPLQYLNISDTGLSPTGWDALLSGLQQNTSIVSFIAGGSNTVKNILDIARIILALQNAKVIDLGGVGIEDKIELHDLSFENLKPATRNSCLAELNLTDCKLTDTFVATIFQKYANVLSSLELLKLSNNPEVSENAFNAVQHTCKCLHTLHFALMDAEFVSKSLNGGFKELRFLNLRKSRVSVETLGALSNIPQTLTELALDGIKLSGSDVLETLLQPSSKHKIITLSMSGCSLTDKDIKPLATAMARPAPPLNFLSNLDLSVNRLTDSTLSLISESLLAVTDYTLKNLDLTNNKCADKGALDLAGVISSASCKLNLQRLLLSSNCLTVNGIQALVLCVAPRNDVRGLQFLDVSNQKDGLSEDEIEAIVECLITTIGLDPSLIKSEHKQTFFPPISDKFTVNLSRLGGSAGDITKRVESVAIKTDFSRLFKGLAALSDYLILGSGILRSNSITDPAEVNLSIDMKEWSEIIGSDAPAWLKVSEERRRGVYVNHLPGTATVQRLEGLLEMEADCEVSDIYVIKDPILRKPTGAAWVLFANEESVNNAMKWFAAGCAQMYGTPFSICVLPVCTTGDQSGGQASAKRELQARERQRQTDLAADRTMMEESQQLADERAAYREAHPAYQNGRIW